MEIECNREELKARIGSLVFMLFSEVKALRIRSKNAKTFV